MLVSGRLQTTQWLDVQICHARPFVPRKFYGELLVTPKITNPRLPDRSLGSLAAMLHRKSGQGFLPSRQFSRQSLTGFDHKARSITEVMG
jgi:hypothetical protein